jgi:hypothetical protein
MINISKRQLVYSFDKKGALMNDSQVNGSFAWLFATRRFLCGMLGRKKNRGYIRISFALLFTVLAVLWIFNRMATNQRLKDQSTANVKIQHTRSNLQELAKPKDKSAYRIPSQRMEESQQRFIHLKKSTDDSIQEEEIEQEIINDEVYESRTDSGGDPAMLLYSEDLGSSPSADDDSKLGGSDDPATFMYSEDEGLNQSADNNHARSMADLVRSIENLETAETNQMGQAIRDVWIIAADLDAPDEALETLEYFIMEHNDKELIDLANSAIEDLQRVLESKQGSQIQAGIAEGYDDEDQSGPSGQIALTNSHDDPKVPESSEVPAILQAQMEDLSEQALFDTDASKRGDAIQTLSNFRSDTAVDILIDAADDPEPMNRYLALQSLWISAADSPLGKDNLIWHSLQQAQDDMDTQVADLASKALKDLEQLEQNLAEAEAAISFEPEHYSEDVSPAGQMHEPDSRSDPSTND